MVDDELRGQCALLGIDPDRIVPRERQITERPDFELWPEHWPAWMVFLGCSTQWDWEQGQRTGLNYSRVEIVASRYGVKKKRRDEVFQQVQVLEREALKVWKSQSKS